MVASRRHVLLHVVLLLGIVAAGCKSESSSASKVDPAQPSGDVREVAGKVTASRDGHSRTLVVGDEVAAGDLIETGTDGDVVIELRHNHVRWHLGPGQSRKPIDAMAWKGSAPDEVAKVGGERTTSAGRIAEREGADTAASAVEADNEEENTQQQVVAEKDQAVERALERADDQPETVTRKPKVDRASKKKRDEPTDGPIDDMENDLAVAEPTADRRTTAKRSYDAKDSARKPDPKPDQGEDPPSAGCDEVACVLDPGPACCKKYGGSKKPERSEPDGAAADLPDSLDADMVKTGMGKARGKLTACGDKHPGAPATVKVSVKVSPSGVVTSVSMVDTVDDGVAICLRSAISGVTFTATDEGGSFKYPIKLR